MNERIIIIGAGHFGRRAAEILSKISRGRFPLLLVDTDRGRLSEIEVPWVRPIEQDGIDFIVKDFESLPSLSVIIPAVPLHLAAEWLKRHLQNDLIIKPIEVPESIKGNLHTWEGTERSLLISVADFLCPDDCPEPADFCTVTGKKRGTPLYQRLRQFKPIDYRVYIIRSRQMAPGLGGYRVEELRKLQMKVKEGGAAKWLIGTACKCHGTISALEVRENIKR